MGDTLPSEPEALKVEWDALQRLRANLAVLLRHTNALPFRWGSYTFKCYFCPHKSFTESKVMRSHFSAEHENFNSPDVIRQAMPALRQIRFDVTALRCKLCSNPFDDLHTLAAHLIQKHNVKYYTGFERYLFQVKLDCSRLECFECGKEFNFFQPLLMHYLDEHERSIFLCHLCGKGFEFEYKLCAHRDTKHAPPIKCSRCEKTFTNKTNKKAHEVMVHKIGAYTCKECGQNFNSFHKRKRHAMAEHDQGNRYVCRECSVTFLYNKKLQQHIKTVHRKERETCPICNIKVIYLENHMICHSNEKPFVCEVCQKSFARKRNIVAHMKRHNKSGKS